MRFEFITAAMACCLLSGNATAQQADGIPTLPESVYLFKNVRVFDGLSDSLQDVDVLVVQNKIHRVEADLPQSGTWDIEVSTGGLTQQKDLTGGMDGYTLNFYIEGGLETRSVDVEVVDGGGRTLMPGLIDSHVHINMYRPGTVNDLENTTWEEIGARAAAFAQEMLANGFTTIRDLCGAHEGLKKVIDEGLLPGPRIYLSGGCISQTSGHGDWGLQTVSKGSSYMEQLEMTRVVDGVDEVLEASRRNFRMGAHFLKLMVGGGVTSIMDPLFGSQFTEEEIRAAVETAEDWGTYVAVHVHMDSDIARALDAGVMSIEHAMTISEENMQKLVELGAFYSPNLGGIAREAMAHPMHRDPTFPPTVKFTWLVDNSSEIYDLIRKYRPKIVFNSDYVLLTGVPFRQAMDFTKHVFAREFGNFWTLQMMTSTAGELAAMTTFENPYPDGRLGVIEEGAYADILLVDGNPLDDFSVIGANEKWFDAEPRGQNIPTIRLIMKDGVIYKNTLSD